MNAYQALSMVFIVVAVQQCHQTVNSDWLSQLGLLIFNHHSIDIHPLTNHQKNFARMITSATPTLIPNLVQTCLWGVVEKWAKYIIIYTSISGAHPRSDWLGDYLA